MRLSSGERRRQKIRKTGGPLRLELVETPDIVATLAAKKGGRWMVAFALETEDRRGRGQCRNSNARTAI